MPCAPSRAEFVPFSLWKCWAEARFQWKENRELEEGRFSTKFWTMFFQSEKTSLTICTLKREISPSNGSSLYTLFFENFKLALWGISVLMSHRRKFLNDFRIETCPRGFSHGRPALGFNLSREMGSCQETTEALLPFCFYFQLAVWISFHSLETREMCECSQSHTSGTLT